MGVPFVYRGAQPRGHAQLNRTRLRAVWKVVGPGWGAVLAKFFAPAGPMSEEPTHDLKQR